MFIVSCIHLFFQGLVVPVIRNVENMNYTDIERSIAELGEKVRILNLMCGLGMMPHNNTSSNWNVATLLST